MGRTSLSRTRSARTGTTGAVLLAGLAFGAACSTNSAPPPAIGDTNDDAGPPIYRAHDGSTGGGSMDATMGTSSTDGAVGCGDANSFMCTGHCVDIMTDMDNCGGCTQPCGTGQTCSGGACVCNGLLTSCNGQCVDTTTDPTNCGSCFHSCEGTTASCADSLCQATVIAMAAGGLTVTSIAVDSTTVYWTSPPSTANASGFVSGNSISGNVVYTVAMANTIFPAGIAVDANNIYWTDLNGSVWLGPNPDSQMGGFTYRWTSGGDGGIGPFVVTPVAVTVNQNGPNVYWVDNTANTVDQASKLGGAITVLASGRTKPQAIAVDPADSFVYWVDFGDMTGAGANGTVNATAVGGGGSVKTLASGEDQPEGIAVDGTNVYWTSGANPGTVKMLAINAPAGTAPTVVASNLGSPHGIGIDSQFMYWTNYDDNSVMKAPIAGGGSPYTIAKGMECDNPDALFVDNKNVYWANKGNGSIVKLAK